MVTVNTGFTDQLMTNRIFVVPRWIQVNCPTTSVFIGMFKLVFVGILFIFQYASRYWSILLSEKILCSSVSVSPVSCNTTILQWLKYHYLRCGELKVNLLVTGFMPYCWFDIIHYIYTVTYKTMLHYSCLQTNTWKCLKGSDWQLPTPSGLV